MDGIFWLYVFIALVAIVLIYYIKNFAKQKVDIFKKDRLGMPFQNIGYLEMDTDGSAGEARLPGGGSLPSVGRVIVDKQAGRESGFVQVISTDVEDETIKPRYKQVGYVCFNGDNVIDKFGFVYRQDKGAKERVLVGYCARPSAPNTPTIYGERTWRTLWLKCTLNFYEGKPTPSPDEPKTTAAPTAVANSNVSYHSSKLFDINDENSPLQDAAVESEPEDVNVEPATPQASSTESEPKVVEPTVSPVVEESSVQSTPSDVHAEQETEVPEATEHSEESAPKSEEVSQPEEKGVEESGKKAEEQPKKKKSKKEKKAKKKKVKKEPLISVSYIGFHSSSKDYLPAEARACAFAALTGDMRRGRYSEFFKSQPYGWKDTALLSSVVYIVLYLSLYFSFEVIMRRTLVGDDVLALCMLCTMYFVLWALVRLIKIDCIESSKSFQKILDLFNKNLGLRWANLTIIILSPFAFYFSILSLNFEALPLIFAIAFGVLINMSLRGANKSWIISTSYNEKDEDVEDEEVENPVGDISRTYEWDIDATYNSTLQLHGSVTLYFTAQDMADMRQCNPFFAQRKDKSDKEYILDMFNFLKEHRAFVARVKYIAKYINDTITNNSLTPLDKVQFTLDFVQEPNIRFVSNKNCKSVNNYEDYIRFPDETLYDKEGDCNSKSLLAAMLFHVMGYNVMYLSSRKLKHAAIGIEISAKEFETKLYSSRTDDIFIRENGKYYIFCETTGDRFRVGKLIDGMTISDFEDKVLLEVGGENVTPTTINEKSIIYNWDLYPQPNGPLHGNLVLKFRNDDIETLRGNNPFRTYGYDSNTYEGNVSSMFKYLCEESDRSTYVNSVADYIKGQVEKAGLSELDMVQFVLNFAQVPNISYEIDENCESIGYQKEYMRFPNETLYDKEGDCDCKSFLVANILHSLGYNVIFMLSKKLKHAAIAVECKEEWFDTIGRENIDNIVLEHNGRRYVFCESTGEGNGVGCIKEGSSIKDFDKIIELLA